MKIIGAGFGRTGTASTKEALEKLGYRCYHMFEAKKHPLQFKIWLDAFDGKMPDWDIIFKDFDACIDFPACMFYEDLMKRYPDAKVLLNVRDPEKWYKSLLQTIYQKNHSILYRITRLLYIRDMFCNYMIEKIIFVKIFNDRFKDKAYVIEKFNQHNEAVKQHVLPTDRLLVFDVKEGWEPLCSFLNKPIPLDEPFPSINTTDEFRRVNGMIPSNIFFKITLLVVFIAWGFYYLMK